MIEAADRCELPTMSNLVDPRRFASLSPLNGRYSMDPGAV
jgi:hypothetical protein